MRGRTDHPTTAPEPDGPTDDRIVYRVTKAGRRALADTEPRDTAPEPDTPSDPRDLRTGTISHRFRGDHTVPLLRVSGKWLRDAGFDESQPFTIAVEPGKLTIEAAGS